MNKIRHIESIPEEKGLWYESPEEKETALHRIYLKTAQKQLLEALLNEGILPQIERTCLEVVFFQKIPENRAAKQLDMPLKDLKFYLKHGIATLSGYVKEYNL